MAEAIAVVSFLSAVVGLTEIGWRVVERMKEFQSETRETPATFRQLKALLPITLDSLKRTEAGAKAGDLDPTSQEALLPTLNGCGEQLQLLSRILDRYQPLNVDSKWGKRKKALNSVFNDKETKKIIADLDRYIAILTFHNTSGSMKMSRPLSPRHTRIPAARDPNFIDRPAIFKEMNRSFASSCRAALEGIGGVGKTQIAIEQCYRFRDACPEAHIFWAHAGTISKFGQACKAVAEDLRLPYWNDPQTDVIQLVHRWLTNERTEPWLFVVDNIDDLDVLEDPLPCQNTLMTLGQFLQKSGQGFILITTRDKRIGERLGVRGKTIRVDAMTMPEGRQLLRSYLPSDMEIEKDDLEELVSSLDYIPLAITQAAALITENVISIQEYLAMFRSSDEEMEQLLGESLSDNRRSNHESNSVIKTWRLSFDQITKQCPRAAEILSLMVMFDRQSIPGTLLQRQNESKLTFLKAMGTLQAFSLIAKEADKERYGMHRLVQLSTQAWLKVQQRTAEWIKEALSVLEMRFPGTGQYETWRTCEVLLPHARALLQHEPVANDAQKSRAVLRTNVARYDFDQGRISLALGEAEEAWRTARALLGSRDPLTLRITNQVIVYQIGTSKDREAMELAQQHIPIYEEVLGVDHLETLTCNRNIAFLLSMREKYTEAEAIYRKTLARLETALGGNHESTLTVMSALAGMIWDQGKAEEAENLYREVIAKKERAFGADHPVTLNSIWGLVQCLRLEESFEEAELLCRSLYITARRVLGPEHIRTLLNMSELASSLSAQNKFQEAEDLFRATVERMKKLFDADQHQEITLRAMAKFGECLANQGKHEEAAELYQVAYQLHQNLSGRAHEKTLWIMESFASCLDAPGKPLEAKPYRLLYTQLVSGVKDAPLLPPSSSKDI